MRTVVRSVAILLTCLAAGLGSVACKSDTDKALVACDALIDAIKANQGDCSAMDKALGTWVDDHGDALDLIPKLDKAGQEKALKSCERVFDATLLDAVRSCGDASGVRKAGQRIERALKATSG